MRLLLIAIFTLSLLAQSPEIDRLIATDFIEHVQTFDNLAVHAYIDRIGSQLIAHLPDTRFDYSFKVVVAQRVAEPISIPGGYIFIPAAFFLSAHNEDEFATMLAHSIGHIELKQAARNLAHQQGTATIPLLFVGTGGLHAEPGRTMMPMAFRNLQRENELEADAFGIDLASRARYNSAAFREYLRRTRSADWSTREARLANMDALLRHTPAAPPSPNEEFLRLQQAVRETLKP